MRLISPFSATDCAARSTTAGKTLLAQSFAQNLCRAYQTSLSCSNGNACKVGDFLYRPIIGLTNLNHNSQSGP